MPARRDDSTCKPLVPSLELKSAHNRGQSFMGFPLLFCVLWNKIFRNLRSGCHLNNVCFRSSRLCNPDREGWKKNGMESQKKKKKKKKKKEGEMWLGHLSSYEAKCARAAQNVACDLWVERKLCDNPANRQDDAACQDTIIIMYAMK